MATLADQHTFLKKRFFPYYSFSQSLWHIFRTFPKLPNVT